MRSSQGIVAGERSPRLSICVVNYQTPQLTTDCLKSILKNSADDIPIVVVDNGSRDDSASQIAAWLTAADPKGRCSLLALESNGGFSSGYNAAIQAQRAPNYLLLNSDTILLPGVVERLLKAADDYHEVGLFGPKLVGPDGKPQVSCFRDPTPLGELVIAARTRPVSALFRQAVVPIEAADIPMSPDWLSFAAVMIRHETLERVGYLDPNFFLYFEDVEYCGRARKAGFTCLYIPGAEVVHLHGQSTQVETKIAARSRLPSYYYASRNRYFRLKYGRIGPFIANAGWYLGRAISGTREVFGAKLPHLPAAASRDIWIGWRH